MYAEFRRLGLNATKAFVATKITERAKLEKGVDKNDWRKLLVRHLVSCSNQQAWDLLSCFRF